MTVYKTFFKIVKAYKGSIILYTLIFLGLSIIMSSLTSTNKTVSFDQTKIDMTVIDHDNSSLSKGLTKYLDSTQSLVSLEDNKEVWTDELFNRSTNYILVIPKGFEEDFVLGKENLLENYTLPDSIQATFIDMQIDQYLSTLNSYLSSGVSNDLALAAAASDCSIKSNVAFLDEGNIENSGEKPSHYYFFQFIPYAFLCLFILGLGPVLIAFKSPLLKKRMDCAALSISRRNIKTLFAAILFTILFGSLFTIAAFILFSSQIFTSEFAMLCLNLFVFAFLSLALTYLLTQFVNDTKILNPLSNVISLGSCFLCGIFVPSYLLGDNIITVSQFLPPFWYIKAIDSAFDKDVNMYFFSLLIQAGFGIAFVCISLVLSKQKVSNKH